MPILQILVVIAAISALGFLILHQIAVQVNEYYFYKSNGWDFSVDSGLDRLNLYDRVIGYRWPLVPFRLTYWQRFYLFRPFYIAIMAFTLIAMVASLF